MPVPVSAKAPSGSFHGAVALPGFSRSWNISVPLRQGSPGGSEVPGSDTEPRAPASHFPCPAAFGAEPHSAPDPSVGQLEALSELPGLVFPLGKHSGVQRARAPLGD